MFPVRLLISSPLDTYHIPIELSKDPDIKYSPFGENTKLVTVPECPVRVLMSSPFDALHTLIVLSWDPDIKYSPFGEYATLLTAKVCPVIV